MIYDFLRARDSHFRIHRTCVDLLVTSTSVAQVPASHLPDELLLPSVQHHRFDVVSRGSHICSGSSVGIINRIRMRVAVAVAADLHNSDGTLVAAAAVADAAAADVVVDDVLVAEAAAAAALDERHERGHWRQSGAIVHFGFASLAGCAAAATSTEQMRFGAFRDR